MSGGGRLSLVVASALCAAMTGGAQALPLARSLAVTAPSHPVIAIDMPRAKPRPGDPIATLVARGQPLPRPKPALDQPQVATAPAPVKPAAVPQASSPSATPLSVSVGKTEIDDVPARNGSLKDGLDALSKNQFTLAIAIRNGMKPSLERKILDWQLARSGSSLIPSAFITRFAAENRHWPDARLLRIRAEAALLEENPPASKVLAVFAGSTPISTDGTIVLARAQLNLGRKDTARDLARNVWRNAKLSSTAQTRFLKEFGALLTSSDHQTRAHAMLYQERVNDALRVADKLSKDEKALIQARVAVIRRLRTAGKLLDAVPKSLRDDPAYLFEKARYLRRKENWTEAGKLLAAAPRDRRAVIDPDAWWTERRIVSRKLLELGEVKTAYKIAAGHSALSPAEFAEAEFHAGWYALRFLKDPAKARPHFQRILEVGQTAITRSRGYYWLGRTDEARGNTAAAHNHYEKAAAYGSAFYGQLARAKLGKSSVGVPLPPQPGSTDKAAFERNELVQAIKALNKADHISRTLPLFLQLSKSLPNAAQAALLVDLAEQLGKHRYALIAGKEVAGRWPEAASLAFPLNAIPKSTRIKDGVEKPMVYAIARQESAFDPAAISHAGARGLLQLMPGTARATAKRHGLAYSQSRLTSDPAYNATLGAAHLGELVDDFNGSYIMTFAGYNAGPRRVSEWVERFGDPRSGKVDPIDWIETIPFTETRNYVQRITENLQVYRKRLNGSGLQIEKDLRRGRPG